MNEFENPYNVSQIKGIFETFGLNTMPWGLNYSVLVILIFIWVYLIKKVGFEKSLLTMFFDTGVGLLIQFWLFGVDIAFKIMAVFEVFLLIVYFMFLKKV